MKSVVIIHRVNDGATVISKCMGVVKLCPPFCARKDPMEEPGYGSVDGTRLGGRVNCESAERCWSC